MRDAALKLLQKALADPSADFRTGQWECIQGILRSQQQLVVQKTGWGKSIGSIERRICPRGPCADEGPACTRGKHGHCD